jgi:hypothetical protein
MAFFSWQHMNPVKRTVLLGFVVLYLGLAIGLPLVLTGWPPRGEAKPVLIVAGALLIAVGFVAPLVLLRRAAARLKARAWLYVVLAALFYPIGTVFALTDLWERCREGQGTTT